MFLLLWPAVVFLQTEPPKFCFSVPQHSLRGSQNPDDIGQHLGHLTSGNSCWWSFIHILNFSWHCCFTVFQSLFVFSKSLSYLCLAIKSAGYLICYFTRKLEAISDHPNTSCIRSVTCCFHQLAYLFVSAHPWSSMGCPCVVTLQSSVNCFQNLPHPRLCFFLLS